MSVRIQRRRTKGWRMPEGAIYVGRPSPWGNHWEIVRQPRTAWNHETPFGVWAVEDGMRVTLGSFVNEERARYWAVQGFRRDFDGDVEPLRGHDLVCWCPLDQPCHADVLLELANRPREGER